MLSLIVTAWNEEKSITKVLDRLLDKDFLEKLDAKDSWELLLCTPDEATRTAGHAKWQMMNLPEEKLILLEDQGRGKPAALNLCFNKAAGEWLFLTDGDVFLEPGGLERLWNFAHEIQERSGSADKKQLGGVTMRPVARHQEGMVAYWGGLLANAAHHKRMIDLTDEAVGLSTKIVPKRKFFPLSGYGMLIRNLNWSIPEDCLIDDAYLSYELFNRGYKLAYCPDAQVSVKYPNNLKDYFAQKKRSVGGYVQLWQYGVVSEETKTRSFWRELEYVWFPLRYAQNLRELWWSLLFYPARLWLWLKIYWERKIVKKDFVATWTRIESTK